VRLSDSNNQNESYYCNRCSVEYPDTTNIRQQLKISVPDRDQETLVSTTLGIDYLNKSVEIHHEPEIKGGLKALQQRGIKITNYKEDIPK
jgi:ribosomal protein L30/L7E